MTTLENLRCMKRLEGMTIKGMHYVLGRIQIWAVMLILVLPLCITSIISTVRVGRAEAKSYATTATTAGMTDKDAYKTEAKNEKDVLNAIWDETWFILKPFYWLFASFLGMKDWKWKATLCVEFLHWLSWAIVSVAIAIRSVFRALLLHIKLRRAKSNGKVEMEKIVGFNLPFTGRGLFILTVLTVAYMIVLLGAPVWLMYFATLSVLHFEKKAFYENGGRLYDSEKKFWVKEIFSELQIGQKISNGLANTYGYEAGAKRRKNEKLRSSLPSRTDYGD